MIYASLRTYRDSVTELNTLFIIRSLSFFSPNPPIKWIQMNFSHKPNAVLLSLKCSLLRRYKDIHLLCGDCAHRCNALSIHKNESFYLFYERAI